MAVYTEDPPKDAPKGKVQDIAFYTSPDLKAWTYQSRISGFCECPDLFELDVGGGDAHKKWVLTAAASHYFLTQRTTERAQRTTELQSTSQIKY